MTRDQGIRRPPVSWIVIVGAGLAGLALLLSPLGTGRTGLLGPAVLSYPADVVAAARRVREDPDDPALRVVAARLFIDEGRASGDASLVRAAETAIDPLLDGRAGMEALTLAAIARQHLHDFSGAVELLNRAIAQRPSPTALLTRANIHVVQGRFDLVEADCRRLAARGRHDLAVLCDATGNMLTAEAPAAYRRLEMLVSGGAMDSRLRGYAHSLLGEIAAFQQWPEQARRHFELARDAEPGNVRAMMVYADFLLSRGKARLALDQMATAPATDAILVRRAIAHQRLGREEELAPIRSELEQRLRHNRQVGSLAHAREEARYLLEVAQDSQAALARAQANWTRQRELEDARLLLDAAAATRAPERAEPVLTWMQKYDVVAPALSDHATYAVANEE